MDEDMWKHAATQHNLATLSSRGQFIISVENGELASGLFGEGRMAEPEHIVQLVIEHLQAGTLKGKKALVTAGPTYEHIDPVRFIGNHSSGKMGVAIAQELASRGAEVHLVLGPVGNAFNLTGLEVTNVQTAEQMYAACISKFETVDIAVMSAAVADYTPINYVDQKIKKAEPELTVALTKTKDILKSLGGIKKDGQVLVGFALETNNGEVNALQKLQSKNADIIVLNSLEDKEAGFGIDTNKVTIYNRKGDKLAFDTKTKTEVAKDIVDYITRYADA